jgi:hypothetical protein
MGGGRLGERRTHFAHVQPTQPYARLHQRDGVTPAPVAQFDEGTEEPVEQTGHLGVVASGERPVEGQGDLGSEAEDRGRVEVHAEAPVRQAGLLRGGQPVEVAEATGHLLRYLGTDRADDALQQIEVSEAVLEPDDAGGAGELRDGGRGEDGVVALVDDDIEARGGGQRRVVLQQSLLRGDDEVRRHRQQAVRSRLFGERGEPAGERRSVAGARHDGHAAPRLVDRHGDALAELLRRQRVELTRAAAREDGSRTRVESPAHMGAEDVEVERAVRSVGRDGEEEQPVEARGERAGGRARRPRGRRGG